MAEKKLTFAGSTIGEPWWTLGEIVAEVLRPHGIQVTVVHESYSQHNIKWISSGKAQVGATTPVHLASALASKGDYQGEKHGDLCSIAVIKRPAWLALAVRHEMGLKSLHDIREQKFPLRILAGSPEKGRELDVILRHYELSLDEILSWGGRYYRWIGRMEGGYVREGVVDAMLGNIYLGYTPHNRFWYESTMLQDMCFLGFDDDLIDKLVREFGYLRGTLPHGLYRGVDRDIPTASTDTIYLYCRKDLPDELAGLIARSLDERLDLFKNSRSVLYYERQVVGQSPLIPLHPSVERYYRSKGYL